MDEQTDRSVYRHRRHWVPATAAAVGLSVLLASPGPPAPWSPWGLLLGTFGLFVAVVAVPSCWRRVVLTRATLEFHAGWQPRQAYALRQLGLASRDAHGLILVTGRSVVRLSRQFRPWLHLAAQLEARVQPLPALRPLGSSEIGHWLSGEPLRLWARRPASDVIVPACRAGAYAGGVVAGLCCVPWLLVEDPRWLVAAVPFGAVVGGCLALGPALLLNAPLRVVVRPGGIVLYGLAHWGARRGWSELQPLGEHDNRWWCGTGQATLGFRHRSRAASRFRRVWAHVLEAREAGRLPVAHGDVPAGALSLAVRAPVTAQRGLSPAPPGGHGAPISSAQRTADSHPLP